jgi:putative drug exporter of the RND superfamily
MTNTRLHTTSGGRAGRGLQSLTRWILAHKRLVATFWIVLTIAGMFGASRVTDQLDDQFSMPSSEAFAANEEIEHRFATGGGDAQPFVAVAELPEGKTADDPAVRADLRALERDLGDALPGARIASYGSTGDGAYVSDDGRTTFAIAHPKLEEGGGPGGEVSAGTVKAAQGAAEGATVGGADVLLTGRAVLEQAPEGEDGPPGFLNETLIAGVAALAILAFVFASSLAAVPLMMAVVAIPTTLLAVLGLTELTDVSFIVVFLASLIGLGLAIDYALIVVMRWREERERGLSNEDAIGVAVSTAGRAVLFSGTTVAIGLLAAVVLPIPFLRSMAYGGLLIPLVSVAVALTLLPVVLATVGPRADRRRLRRTDRAERHWASWARLVVRHRVAAVITGAAALIALVAVASGMLLGDPEADALGGSGEAKAGLERLESSGIGASPPRSQRAPPERWPRSTACARRPLLRTPPGPATAARWPRCSPTPTRTRPRAATRSARCATPRPACPRSGSAGRPRCSSTGSTTCTARSRSCSA